MKQIQTIEKHSTFSPLVAIPSMEKLHNFAMSGVFNSMCEICQNWARSDVKLVCRKPLAPNHHPNCPHYNDSLIDVWKITDGSTSCYAGSEEEANAIMEGEAAESDSDMVFRVVKQKMHREIFENLPEFEGF